MCVCVCVCVCVKFRPLAWFPVDLASELNVINPLRL